MDPAGARQVLARSIMDLERVGVVLGYGDRQALRWLAVWAGRFRTGEVAALSRMLTRASIAGLGKTAGDREEPRVRGLVIPAEATRPCLLTELVVSSEAYSDALGGGLLDEALVVDVGGVGCMVYLDWARTDNALPRNHRAVLLAAQLGWLEQAQQADLRGDVLLVGVAEFGKEIDLPGPVVDAARASGLIPHPLDDVLHR